MHFQYQAGKGLRDAEQSKVMRIIIPPPPLLPRPEYNSPGTNSLDSSFHTFADYFLRNLGFINCIQFLSDNVC